VNLIANVSNRKGRGIVAALCLFISVLASAAQSGASISSNRFLFIIDTSAAMKPLETKAREAVFDLIYSGMRGSMTNGDTYGIWLVNDRNDTSFAMETWKHHHILEMAARAATHVKDHGFKGKSHLELALADVQNVLKNVGDLTVILVTDGSTPLIGTRFDDTINARWQQIAPGLKRAKATLNTVLIAQDGEFMAWAANSPEFLIEIPKVAPKPKPAKVEVAVTKTNVSIASGPALESVAAPKPRVATTPIIITKESVAQERQSYHSSTPPRESSPTVSAETNAVADATPGIATSPAIVSHVNSSNAAVASTVTEPSAINLPTVSAAPIRSVEPVSLESVAIAPAPIAEVASASGKSSSTVRDALLWASVGAGGMLGCVIIVMVFVRRNRHEPSLISQSFAREQFSIH
jgi:hypothetical protein